MGCAAPFAPLTTVASHGSNASLFLMERERSEGLEVTGYDRLQRTEIQFGF